MSNNLYYQTVSPLLHSILKTLMSAKEFDAFRLVGGTALSLYRGHRLSVDIDLFTDVDYGSVNFEAIDKFLRDTYEYVDTSKDNIIGFGKSYFVGSDKNNCIKLDIFYTDVFIEPAVVVDDIRMATINDIIAMKLEVISHGGRKKDFWDIHELSEDYNINDMFALHEKRHEFTHDREKLKNNFTEFKAADEDFDPVCLKNKYWELIKLDMTGFIKMLPV